MVRSRPLESFPWWQVGVPRAEALAKLSSGINGTFVLRDSSQPGAFVEVIVDGLGDQSDAVVSRHNCACLIRLALSYVHGSTILHELIHQDAAGGMLLVRNHMFLP